MQNHEEHRHYPRPPKHQGIWNQHHFYPIILPNMHTLTIYSSHQQSRRNMENIQRTN